MKLSLDKSKCGWFYRFYQYVLTRFFGIGCIKVKWEDFLYSYVMVNHAFLPSATTTTPSVTTQFVAGITPNNREALITYSVKPCRIAREVP